MRSRWRSLIGTLAVTLLLSIAASIAPSVAPDDAPSLVSSTAHANLPLLASSPRHTVSSAETSLEEDFALRTSGDGVVWFQDFDTAAEVNNFRWDTGYGNDPLDQSVPNTARWRSDDGITAGCLEMFRPAGSTEPPEWWRPFSPLTSPGNGRGENDPGANGTLTPQSYAPTDGGSQIQNWGDRGFYGHTDFHASDPGAFDGTDYYLQVRVKISASRVGQPDGGKLFYFTITNFSNSDQEIVTISNNVVDLLNPSANLFKMYRSGSPSLDGDDPGDDRQPGNTIGVCTASVGSGCFYSPSDEWFTLLYHVTPGHNSGNDTRVEVWVALDGETSYTKVWDQSNVDLPFEPGIPSGHNALISSGFMNAITFTEDVYHRYDQIIFSKEFIPAPQVYEGFAGNVRMFDHVTLFAANEDYFYMPIRRVAGL